MRVLQEGGPRETTSVLEGANLLRVDPADLMRDNPAALIVSLDSYRHMEARFLPGRWEAPHVARVITYSPEGKEVTKLFVIDGLTRTKYIADRKGKIIPEAPLFDTTIIGVRDVTDSEMNNPLTVYPEEFEETKKRGALTVAQSLRATIPPTIAHAEIAKDRIAAHLINGWRNIVGEDLSKKFSAVAALNLLESRSRLAPSLVELKRFLSRQTKLFSDENTQERQRIEQALTETVSVIRGSNLFIKDIAEAAFYLVGTASTSIGGQEPAIREIYGLLYSPQVEKKLAREHQALGDIDSVRIQLRDDFLATTRQFKGAIQENQVIETVRKSLADPDLSLQDTMIVWKAVSPVEQYDHAIREKNRRKLHRFYLDANKKEATTETEDKLIAQVGRVSYLYDHQLPTLANSIREAEEAIRRGEVLRDNLTKDWNELVKQGVAVQKVQERIIALNQARGELLLSDSLQDVSRRIGKLDKEITTIKQEVSKEINNHRIRGIFDEVFEDELESNYAPILRNAAVGYVFQEFKLRGKQESLNENELRTIRQAFGQLKSLDNNFRVEVLSGRTRLHIAILRQEELKKASQIQRVELPKQPVVEKPIEKPIEAPKIEELVLIEEERSLEEIRRAVNNERFINATRTYREALSEIDLEPTELTQEAKDEFDVTFRQGGKIRFNHPDVVRIVRDEAPEWEKKLRKALEAIATLQQEVAQRDARTGR